MSMNFGPEWMRKKVIPTNYDAGTNLSNINNNTMDSYSKGKTVMNDHKVGSNQYKYSKEEVISLWNNKKKSNNKKMSFDYDNKNISSSTEPLHPMSMMSFNNYDKKILGQNSVNNDMASRTSRDFNDRSDRDMSHYKDRNDNRMNSRPFSYNRGSYDQMANGRNDYTMDSNKKFGNIWDSQNRTNNYVGNNMYSLKNKNDLKKPKYKSMSTPLDKDMEMDGVQSNNIDKLNMKDNTNDLISTFDNMTLKTNYGNDKPLNNSLFSNDIFSPFKPNSLNVTKTQSFDDTMKKTIEVNKMDSTRLQGNIFSEPDTIKEIPKEIVIEPPKWNYKDPTGKIQGPFLYEEMQEWYNAGYFEKNLPIKRENDVEFKSLASMIEQYGEEKPFIIDAEKYKKEKELSIKANEAVASTAAVHPPIPSTTTNSKPTIKPIQKTMPSTSNQSSLETTVTSPIGNKTLPMANYSVGGGIGLGRGIGMKDNNSFSNNLDSMYNSFNNNSVNSPKVYNGRNASFPTMSNQYEPVGYPGMNRLSNTMNNPQMMGIPGSQPWMPYNDPSMLGVKGWNDMMGFNDIYNNQFYNYDVMNPDLNKSNFNQHYYYQQLMQQSQFPPQYYQMMRQMPQNQMPFYNMFGQPINAIGMKPQMVPSTIGSIQNEIIPPMNTTNTSITTTTSTTTNNTQSIFSGNDANENASQNTNNNNNMWNSTPQTTINNININTNKAEKINTDSIPIVDNTNTNTEKLNENVTQNNEKETNDNKNKEDIVNDIPINEANTENKDEIEELKESEPEQKEEPKTEIINEEEQNENEKEEIIENDNIEEIDEKKEEDEEEKSSEESTKDDEENKEDNSLEKTEVKEEVKDTITSAPVKNHWKISTNKTQRLSIKEIQELEEKEKLEQLKKEQEIKEKKEKEAAKAAAEAVVTETSPVSHFDSNTVWGAPHNNIQKPTLRQIMQEEENNKKKQKDLQMKEAEGKKINKPTPHVVNTTRSVWAGRPLTIVADGNSKVVSASSLSAAKKEPVKKEIISSASSARPQSSQVSNSINNTPTTAKSENEWTPVGKVVKKSEPSHKITKSSSKTDNSKKGPSDAFMKWCKNTLRFSTSAGVNVDEFINVLLLMPLNETSVIYDICTDTLGGITAIDPLKFAEEFIKRRKMDQNADQSFSAVRGYNSYSHDENKNSNKFIPVKSGKKKNRQNLN